MSGSGVTGKEAAKARFERDVLCAMDEYAVAECETIHRLCQKGMATLLEKERGGQPVEPFVEKRLSRRISRETYYKWVKQETNCLHDLQRFYAVLDRLFEEEGASEGGRLSRLVLQDHIIHKPGRPAGRREELLFDGSRTAAGHHSGGPRSHAASVHYR